MRYFSFLQWLSDGTDLPLETAGNKAIVEIADDSRVLVENHQGVIQYSDCCVGINVSYGNIEICGHDLELIHMTADQLVVTGMIEAIKLIRRKKE